MSPPFPEDPPFPEYRGLDDLTRQVDEIGVRARKIQLGTSVEGRPLVAWDVGEGSRVSVLLAGIHAMEWIGVEVGLALFRQLAADPPEDRVVRVHPLVNPDGYARVERELREGKRNFTRTNARGVDLNRNWPTHWKSRARMLALPFLGDGGPHPRSEPEVDAVVAGLDAIGSIDRALSLHSFGRKVLYPYGGVWRRVQDYERHLEAAEQVARALEYDAVQSARWVPGAFAPGMELDHLHDAYGALSLLVECSRGGLRGTRPGSWVHPFRWFNPPDPGRIVSRLAPVLDAFLRA